VRLQGQLLEKRRAGDLVENAVNVQHMYPPKFEMLSYDELIITHLAKSF
jgi:hypothetical protein